MARNYKLERLQSGESFITSEKGNSMVPLIKSGQDHMLEPATWETVEVGDIAYCKVKGNWYTHLVTAKNEKRGCQISNNSGYVNGWTKAVYGVVTEVIGGKYKRKKQKKNKMNVLVKTNYNWADEIDFPGWEIFEKEEFENIKKQIKEYWDNGGKKFNICVGTNEEIDFRNYDDCVGKYAVRSVTEITDEEAEVIKRVLGSGAGNVTLSCVIEHIEYQLEE